MDAEVTRLVARGRHDPAIACAADDDGLAAQLRMAQQFNGREERVHVDMQDAAVHKRVTISDARSLPSTR